MNREDHSAQGNEKVGQFVQGNLAVFDEDTVLGDDDNFFELGFVDSPFAVELVLFVEKEFGVEVSENDLDLANFSSVARIVAFVNRKLSG